MSLLCKLLYCRMAWIAMDLAVLVAVLKWHYLWFGCGALDSRGYSQMVQKVVIALATFVA